MFTAPPVPMVAVTTFGMNFPGAKFKLDATGIAVPYGYTVSRLLAVPATSVTLRTTAVADKGIGSVRLGTLTSSSLRVVFGPNVGSATHCTHVPVRVSRMRNGVRGT